MSDSFQQQGNLMLCRVCGYLRVASILLKPRARTRLFEKSGKANCIVPSSYSPFFNGDIEGGIRGVGDFVLSVSALCSSDVARSHSRGSTAASICLSTYPSGTRDSSASTDGTKGKRREGAGCLERRQALSSSHRKKASSDPWNIIKPSSPAPLGRATE